MRLRPYPCPVCDAPETHGHTDSEEGRLLEDSTVCRGCGLYAHEYAYGATQERVGWFWLTGSWSDPLEAELERSDLRRAALAEIRAAYRHPEFAGVRKAPRGVLAEWMAEHGFPKQAESLMNCVPEILYLPVQS